MKHLKTSRSKFNKGIASVEPKLKVFKINLEDQSVGLDHDQYFPFNYKKVFNSVHKQSMSFDLTSQRKKNATEMKEMYSKFILADQSKQQTDQSFELPQVNYQQSNLSQTQIIKLNKYKSMLAKKSFDFNLSFTQRISRNENSENVENFHSENQKYIYQKNIDKLSAFIDSEELIIKQKYNIDKTTNMSELSDKDHLNYLKEISSLLFGQFKKFNWIAQKRIDSDSYSFMIKLYENLQLLQQSQQKLSDQVLQISTSKISSLTTQLNLANDTIMKQNTQIKKHDVITRFYSAGLSEDDQDRFLNQVDSFLKQESLLQQLQLVIQNKQNIEKVSFSGVSHNLDEIYQLMQANQEQAKYFAQESEEQIIDTQAFKHLHNDFRNKVKFVQQDTARKILKKMQKNITFKDQEVQCNQEEYKIIIIDQLDELNKKVDNQINHIRAQEHNINTLIDENNKVYNEKVQLLIQIREVKEQKSVVEMNLFAKTQEAENFQFQVYAIEKKVNNMYTEIDNLNKNIQEKEKRIILQEKELEYLRQNDANLRIEI